jgi:predicted nucleic acid-binding protein
MADKLPHIYWDACVFLSYFESRPGRIGVLQALIAEAKGRQFKIVTSSFSQVEVAFVEQEKRRNAADPSVEEAFDRFWRDRSVVTLIQASSIISIQARTYIRQALSQGSRLKPADALHLASAKWVGATEFHTYDRKLHSYQFLTEFIICEPHSDSPQMDLPSFC